jgi:sugar/nucleoside kinase (ribokinase family)
VSDHVVCLGLATLDTITAVPRHPAPDDRVVATAHAVAGGGPAATAAVTLARLGVPVFFVGAVGDDRAGEEIRAGLEAEGVDVSELATVAGEPSPQSSILVGDGTRAIVTYPGRAPRFVPSDRARELCSTARWTHVDHAGYAYAPRDAVLSIDGGNPIHELDLTGVDIYAPTEARLREEFGDAWGPINAGARLVVVTRGEEGSIGRAAGGPLVIQPAFRVAAVDTTGCGDVYHGAFAVGVARRLDLAGCMELASAAAALKCRGLGGRAALPTAAELDAFLADARGAPG